MHQVISFLQKRSKSEKLVDRYIRKMGAEESCSVKRFYNYQLLVKDKLNHYVNAESLAVLKDLQEPLCEVYSEDEQRHYNKISRLLIRYFLTREFDTIILTSKRVNSSKRLDHLVIKRKILEQVSEMFSEWPPANLQYLHYTVPDYSIYLHLSHPIPQGIKILLSRLERWNWSEYCSWSDTERIWI